MSIPEEAGELPVIKSQIPKESAQLPQHDEDPESSPFLISFARYKSSECGINDIDQKRSRKALKLIRDIGTTIHAESDFKNFKLKNVSPNGDYKRLYRSLPPDVEVRELFIDSDKGRIFFFTIQRILFLLCITDAHYNTH